MTAGTRARAALLGALLATVALPAAAHDAALHAPDDAAASAARRTELFRPGVSVAREATAAATSQGRPPLYAGLGAMRFPVTTASPVAQAYVDQGMALAWAFNHAEARRAFAEARRLDPACALCAWGEAWVLGPNINMPMAPEALAPAKAAAARAVALGDGATPRERALIYAMAVRYGDAPHRGEAAFAEALLRAAAAHPDDVAILTLAAEALMNLQPWDYWEAGGTKPKGRAGEIVALLERALAIDPSHPAAIHLYIHAVEASADPGRAEPHADRLRGATPALGHLAHMPSHIYMRVGRHADSVAVNAEAVAADEAMLAQTGAAAGALYRYGYYPHNLHFLMASAEATGMGPEAMAAAEKLATVMSDEVAGKLGWVQAIKAAPITTAAQFADPATILALPEAGAGFPFVEGHRRYARGLARLMQGDADGAADEAAAVEALVEGADFAAIEAQGVPARAVLGIASRILRARIAEAAGDGARAVALLEEAAAMQDALPYMEPPFWRHAVRRTLGAVLLGQGDAAGAAAAFEAALKATPRDAWALWGLAEARAAAGDAEGAAAARTAHAAIWRGEARLLALSRL